MTDPLFRQQRFELIVGDFVPQRFAFNIIGVDITRARNMAQQIEFRCPPGGFKHFPVTFWFGRDSFTLLQIMQPLRKNQLFNVRQLLQALRLL
ncbi:hypothetical protein D3C81_1722650 [compost metagenome]